MVVKVIYYIVQLSRVIEKTLVLGLKSVSLVFGIMVLLCFVPGHLCRVRASRRSSGYTPTTLNRIPLSTVFRYSWERTRARSGAAWKNTNGMPASPVSILEAVEVGREA